MKSYETEYKEFSEEEWNPRKLKNLIILTNFTTGYLSATPGFKLETEVLVNDYSSQHTTKIIEKKVFDYTTQQQICYWVNLTRVLCNRVYWFRFCNQKVHSTCGFRVVVL